LAEAEPGGLGLLMMHEYADELSYRRNADQNELTFSVVWAPAA
jgi:anti-sigma regulatory factor (Ser/Thr protein kinase)